MKSLRAALVLCLIIAPAFAHAFDLPRLTWPDDAPTSQGCSEPTQIAAPAGCPKS